MLYDLSLAWTPDTSPAELDGMLAMSAELGYDVVAVDHIYSGPPPSAPTAVTNPLPEAVRTAAASNTLAHARRRPTILHRATVVVSDVAVNHRLPAVAAAYDIVAVRPTTEKAFQTACLSMAEPALISLDLTSYFPFYFKHRACMAAVRRGVHFEVCYSQALRASASSAGGGPRARALFVANLAGLIRATRGRGIVLSSGARAALDLRGPADVVNLLAVWGLPPDHGTEGMAALPRSVVTNEGLRRRGFRGVVDIVQTAGGAHEESCGKPQDQQQKQQPKQKQKQGGPSGSDPRKRKADGQSGGSSSATKKQRKGGGR